MSFAVERVIQQPDAMTLFLLDAVSTGSLAVLAPHKQDNICSLQEKLICRHSALGIDDVSTSSMPCCRGENEEGRCFFDRCVLLLPNETLLKPPKLNF